MGTPHLPRNRVRGWTLAAVVFFAPISATAALLALQAKTEPLVVDDAALGNEAGGDNWLAYGRTYSEQRFSPLTQVSDRTVSRLAPDWFVDLPTTVAWSPRRSSWTGSSTSSAA